jgi:hypothetical protein
VQAIERFAKPWAPVSEAGETVTASPASPIYFAAIFAWTMSAVSAAMCAIVRWPLGSPHWFVFVKASLLLAGAISCALILTIRRVEQRGGSYAVVPVATLAVMFLPCLAWVIGSAADVVAYPILLGLFAAGLGQTVMAVRAARNYRWMSAIAYGTVAGFGYFLVINARGYATVLAPEQAMTGLLHMDTVFHASIANMIVHHGALSTGLDGFVPIQYHVLSHIWLGCLGLWLGVTTPESYYLGAQIVAVPMLLFSLVLATYLLRPAEARRNADAALIVLVPLLLLCIPDIWGWISYLVSESYFVAMIAFLLALPLLAEIAEPGKRSGLALQILALAVAIAVMTLSKISVGPIFLAACAFLFWRRLGLTFATLIKFVAPILLALLLVAYFTFGNAKIFLQGLDPLSFFREYPSGAWPNIVANGALLIAAALIWRRGTLRDRRCAEAFAVIAVAASVPALMLNIPGGSAYYFINVGTFAGIVLIAAYGGAYLEQRRAKFLRPAFVVAAICVVVLATGEKRASARKFAAEFGDLQSRIRALNGEGVGEELRARQQIMALLVPGHPARTALASDVKRTAGAQSEQTLMSMGLTVDAHAAVFVPPDNVAFWSLYTDCRSVPFFIPAVLGTPLLRGINPSALKCPKEPYYGYPAYGADAVSQPSTDSELCDRAAKWGLRTVFVLHTPVQARKIDCSPPAG